MQWKSIQITNVLNLWRELQSGFRRAGSKVSRGAWKGRFSLRNAFRIVGLWPWGAQIDFGRSDSGTSRGCSKCGFLWRRMPCELHCGFGRSDPRIPRGALKAEAFDQEIENCEPFLGSVEPWNRVMVQIVDACVANLSIGYRRTWLKKTKMKLVLKER